MDVKLPDGTVIQNVPDGISKADLVTKLKANGMPVPDSWMGAPAPAAAPPTSMVDKLKGLGETLMTMGSGAVAKPISDVAGLGAIANDALGLQHVDPEQAKAAAQRELTYSPRTQQGKDYVGAAGNLADKTLGRFSRAVGDSAAQDAQLLGASQNVQDVARSGGTEFGNQIPSLLGTKAPGAGQAAQANAATSAVATAPRQALIQQSLAAGYKVPPAEMVSAPIGKALTGVAGKDQINRGFAIANEQVTTNLAKQDLGIAADVPLNEAAVAKVKDNANAVYATIKKADQTQIPVTSPNGVALKGPTGQPITKAAGPVTTDAQFAADIQNIGADRSNATFGTKIDSAVQDLRNDLNQQTLPTNDLIKKITELRQDARTNLNTIDDVSKKNLGRAQQQAADALEAQMGRYLQSTGQSGLLSAWQQARTTLAKAHTVEDAMSGGRIDPAVISRYRANGGFVGGNLKVIADAADTLGNVVRNTDKVSPPEPFSKMQFLASLGGLTAGGGQVGGHAGAITGGAAATLMAGPSAARNLLASRMYQGSLGGSQVPKAGMLANIAANPASPLAGLLTNPDAEEGAAQ